MLRILLFGATNIAILLIFSIVARMTGLDHWFAANFGGSYVNLLVFCAVFGMGGSVISLLLSKTMAKRGMGVRIIDNPRTPQEIWLVETVQRQAEAVGIGMPEVGIFHDQSANAFATGSSKHNALVAVSEGLLNRFDRQAVEAVMGHEIAHVANGDMVTMTLLQGILNTFVLFFAHIVGRIIDQVIFKNEEGRGIGSFFARMLAQVVFGVLAQIIVSWFSRYREYRADEGGARLASSSSMVKALQSLQRENQPAHMTEQLAAFGIRAADFKSLFATHPPLEKRIAHLQSLESD